MLFNPTTRPGLAYQHAFDWLAVQLAATSGPTMALVATPFHGVELLRRLPDQPLGEPFPPGLVPAVHSLGITPIHVVDEAAEIAAIAWVEPRYKDATLLPTLRERLRRGGMLYLVAGGTLARFLAESQQAGAAHAYWPVAEAYAALAQSGFRLRAAFGLHGLVATAWHYLGEIFGRLGQRHWRDRAHFGMRRAFVTPYARHWPVALACLTLQYAP